LDVDQTVWIGDMMNLNWRENIPKSAVTMSAKQSSSPMPFGQYVCLMGLAATFGLACDDGAHQDNQPISSASHLEFLENIAGEIIYPNYVAFHDAAVGLENATEAYLLALEQGDENADGLKLDAQEKWSTAIGIWQQVEVAQIGPAGPAGLVVGGESKRDEIYSWPSVNSCSVDQQIVNNDFAEDGYFARKLVYVYGLDAMEYALFHEGEDNTCAAPASINTDGSWAELDYDMIQLRRASFSVAAAQHLRAEAESLMQAWEPEQNNFRAAFVLSDNIDTHLYESSDQVINELFQALYYVEVTIKDRKLATSIGLNDECGQSPCPESLESKWAKQDAAHIENNLIGFRAILTGLEGIGFDDLLIEEGEQDTSEQIIEKTDDALDSIRHLTGTMNELLEDDPNQLVELHGKLKSVTDILKTQFTGILNVQIPTEGAGDTD
jgi:uncharacterized protein